ncbi:glycosyltransferase [Comamonadaceae bacterium G21597-S1]|nr:glycosyltransferase [Comamonadaceae bacterium G21597-S1]
MSRKVLIIAYHFPPVRGSSGIQRTLKFATYLRDHGWEPLVLTVTPRAYEQVSDDQMGEIPEGTIVERAFALNTAQHLSIGGRYPGWMAQPDRWVSWWPFGVRRGMQMIREHRPVAILSTYPISTAHLIGLTLRRLSGLPWIADCRDSMTEPGYPENPLTWRTNRRLEQAMVKHSSAAVFTTEGTLKMYSDRYPEVPASRWTVIENGFDEENFQHAEQGFTRERLGPAGQLTLVHSGVLYPKERDPRPFFAAVKELKITAEISAANLKIRLRAPGSLELYQSMLKTFELEDMVELAPPVSYREALQEMLCADGLLLFQAAMCNHQIPAKLYEYFRAGRPILALTDVTGNTAQALRAAGSLSIVNIADQADISGGLRDFLASLRNGSASGVPLDVASLNSRRSRASELAKLLDRVTKQS